MQAAGRAPTRRAVQRGGQGVITRLPADVAGVGEAGRVRLLSPHGTAPLDPGRGPCGSALRPPKLSAVAGQPVCSERYRRDATMRQITRPTGPQTVAYNCGRAMGRHQPGIAMVARTFGFVPREA